MQKNAYYISNNYNTVSKLSYTMSIYEAIDMLRSCQTGKLMDAAASIRDHEKGKVITYSRKIFIPVVNLCRDECKYCGYRKEPAQGGSFISLQEIEGLVKKARDARCTEALLVAGDRPEARYPEAKRFLHDNGAGSTADYLLRAAETSLAGGLLPHTDAGLLSMSEMGKLKNFNASMGVMLESTSRLLLEPGMAHWRSQSKVPSLRIMMLENAGKLKIPMTTGILLGIGETIDDIVESLFEIKRINDTYGNIQEVIIQGYTSNEHSSMGVSVDPEKVKRVISIARLILGPGMNIQSPPNLLDCESIMAAGANDLGGISPLTIDYVNPERPWPKITELEKSCNRMGFKLRIRLPVYPEFIERPGYVSVRVMELVEKMVDKSGLVMA